MEVSASLIFTAVFALRVNTERVQNAAKVKQMPHSSLMTASAEV